MDIFITRTLNRISLWDTVLKHTQKQPTKTNPPTYNTDHRHYHHFRPSDTRVASYGICAPQPSHLSRVSLSQFSIFSSAVRCNTGNVIDELLPKFVLPIRKSYREYIYMNYYFVKSFH